MFINIHSHHAGEPGALTIQSLYKDFDRADDPGYYSIGLHPWYLDEDTWMAEWEKARMQSQSKQVVAIGECGLDKICATNWSLQEKAFNIQLSWANEIRKPVIIHCVRAFDETLRMISDVATPCIFHGFNRGLPLADQIIRAGHYISFGKALLSESSKQVLANVPEERYFLETDDTDIPISHIYQAAAEARGVNTETIILQCRKNLERIFAINTDILA